MKTTTLVSLVGVAFISLAQPVWARGGGGGGHFGGGGAHFGGGRGFGGGARSYGGGARYFGGGARFYSGGPRFSSFGARPSIRPRAFAGSSRSFTAPSSRSTRTVTRQAGQFGASMRRPGSVSGTRAFGSSNRRMNIVANRHGATWQRNWDRRRPHFYGNRYYVFDDGFWYGLDDGYYPWDFDPAYPYAYDAPDHDGYDQSADPYSASTVGAVQSQLAGQGYYRGPVDGIYGRQTRAALTRYQTDHKLQVTGDLNSGTLQALGVTQTASN